MATSIEIGFVLTKLAMLIANEHVRRQIGALANCTIVGTLAGMAAMNVYAFTVNASGPVMTAAGVALGLAIPALIFAFMRGARGAVVRLSESGRVAFDRLSATNRPIEGDFEMRRETAEKIIAAMKETDVALNKVHDALCEIENEEVRKQIITKYFDLVNDARVNIAMEVVKYFPYLHPDKPKT